MIKRTTTLYVMTLASILQAAMSLISLASFVSFFWHNSAAVTAAYTVQQRCAWAVAALWSMASLVAGIAMLRRRTWARKLYAVGGGLVLLAWFALLPWPLVLAAVVPIGSTIAALHSRAADLHLQAVNTGAPPGRRRLIAQVLFAAATVLLYSTYLGMFLGHGWMYAQFRGHAPLNHFIAWVVMLAAAILVAPRGTRAWQCGVALMVFVVTLSMALIGYIPYKTGVARYLGAPLHPFDISWGPTIFGVAVVAFVAWLLLLQARMPPGPKSPPTHGDLPDFA